MRRLDEAAARRFKGGGRPPWSHPASAARWCLLKNPQHLNDDQAATLRWPQRRADPYT